MVGWAMVSYPLGNYLVTLFGDRSRPVIAIGGILSIGSVLICAYCEVRPRVFVFLYSIGMGMLKGLMLSSVLRAGWSHLPERKGLVSGCIISGFGFGGFVFSTYT